jgi:drug/metabolite transporter (DMT)-like permease
MPAKGRCGYRAFVMKILGFAMRFWDSAFGLLVVTGGLLGLTLPFGKIATAAGVPAMVWAFVISLGAGGVLLCVLLLRRQRIRLTPRKLRYFFITAAVSYAIPNLLMFSAIPHLGAGYTGIMFTLSPVITLVFSILLGVRRPNVPGVIGIVVGFVGAVMVAVTRGEAGQPADLLWVGLGLLIPVSLAIGNIYRTVDWPDDAGPIELAVGSHLASAAMLFAGILVLEGGGSFSLLGGVPLVVIAQVASASAMFAFFFRLQAVGGPVYLSQIGYVAAAVGLFSGTIFLGEHYQLLTWAGAVIVTVGVVITTRAQSQKD